MKSESCEQTGFLPNLGAAPVSSRDILYPRACASRQRKPLGFLHPFVDDSVVGTAIPVHSQLGQTAVVTLFYAVIVVAGEQSKLAYDSEWFVIKKGYQFSCLLVCWNIRFTQVYLELLYPPTEVSRRSIFSWRSSTGTNHCWRGRHPTSDTTVTLCQLHCQQMI